MFIWSKKGIFGCAAMLMMLAACGDDGKSVAEGGASEETRSYASLENITVGGRASRLVRVPKDTNLNEWASAAEEGAVIRLSELDSVTLDTTGKFYYARCTNSSGEFYFDSVSLKSPYVMLELAPYVEGEWWEWDGNWNFPEYDPTMERYTVTYSVIVDVRKTKNVDINVMTFLETARIRYLVNQGQSFADAKQQADADVLEALGLYGEDFVFDKSDYAESQNSLTAVNYVGEFVCNWIDYERAPSEMVEAFAAAGSFSQVDSLRDFFVNEIYNWSKYGRMTDSELAFMGGFMAGLYDLGECTAEREGFIDQETVGNASMNISCGSGIWTYKKIFTVSNAVNAVFGVMTDARDGRTYKTVSYSLKYEDQTWLAEDLAYNSTDGFYTLAQAVNLPDSVVALTLEECRESYGEHAYCDMVASSDYSIDYKRLGQAIDSVVAATGTSQYRGICPEGWHLPNGHEWRDLLGWIDDKLGEEDRNYMWGDDYLARAGFEGSYSGGTREYVVKLDSRFNDYYREWEYENNEEWATLIRFKIGGWYIVSSSPNRSFRVRCLMD